MNDDELPAATIAVLQGIEEFIGAIFSRAAAYTNTIILAGYAAFFAIWSFTRELVPVRAQLLAALLMMVSCSMFVAWEVFHMLYRARMLSKLASSLSDRADPAGALERNARRLQARGKGFLLAWYVMVTVTILSGMAGGFILTWGLVVELVTGLRST